MASILLPELNNDSVASSPRSEYHNQCCVRFVCTFGGRFLPRSSDNQLSYVGGDNRMVAIQRHTTFASLLGKFANSPDLVRLSSDTPASRCCKSVSTASSISESKIKFPKSPNSKRGHEVQKKFRRQRFSEVISFSSVR